MEKKGNFPVRGHFSFIPPFCLVLYRVLRLHADIRPHDLIGYCRELCQASLRKLLNGGRLVPVGALQMQLRFIAVDRGRAIRFGVSTSHKGLGEFGGEGKKG
jgi:hypothetical protein